MLHEFLIYSNTNIEEELVSNLYLSLKVFLLNNSYLITHLVGTCLRIDESLAADADNNLMYINNNNNNMYR